MAPSANSMGSCLTPSFTLVIAGSNWCRIGSIICCRPMIGISRMITKAMIVILLLEDIIVLYLPAVEDENGNQQHDQRVDDRIQDVHRHVLRHVLNLDIRVDNRILNVEVAEVGH